MTLFQKCEFCAEPAAAKGQILTFATIQVCEKHLNEALELLYVKNLRMTTNEWRAIGTIVGGEAI